MQASIVDRYVLGRTANAEGAGNNLALLRVAAAGAVLYAHCWPIALGASALDPGSLGLHAAFGESAAVASLAVQAFFVISGYLVTGSALTRGLASFVRARALRIFPALVANTLFCAFVLGAAMTVLPLADYLADGQLWKYAANNLFAWNVIYVLPGVFGDNPLHAVNGSLWTLPLEIRCYVAVGLLLSAGVLRRPLVFTGVALGLLAVDSAFHGDGPFGAHAAANCYGAFLMGAVLRMNRRWAPPSPLLGAALFAAAALAPHPEALRLFGLAGWAVGVLWLGLAAPRAPWPERALGDPSYGVYIWAFPIQQTIVHVAGMRDPWALFALAGPATLVVALISWRLVESPMLKLKGAAARPVSSTPVANIS